jgi:hypothetical protein
MNWFEDDKGQWWNLDLAKAIYPPGPIADHAEIEFSDNDQRIFTLEEWVRLKAHLQNSQRPADRREEAPRTRTSDPNPASQPNSTPKE